MPTLNFSLDPTDCVIFVLLVVAMMMIAYERGRAKEVDLLVEATEKLRQWEDDLIRREEILSSAIDEVAEGKHDYSGVERFS